MTDNSQQSAANRTLNRRRALQLGGAGLAALTGAPQLVAASDGEQVEYVRYLKGNPPNRKKVWDSVPFEHWAVRFTADDVRKRVQRRIDTEWGEDALLRAGFRPMPESPTGFGVRVSYITHHRMDGTTERPEPSIDEVRRRLPDRAAGEAQQDKHSARREGIPIRVVRKTEWDRGDNCDGEDGECMIQASNYDYLPGGIMAYYEYNNASASACAAFNSDHYGMGWIGSGHAGDDGGNLGAVDYDTDKFAEVKDFFNGTHVDWCFMDSGFGEIPEEKIADPDLDGTYDYDVAGIVKDSTLKNHVGTTQIYYTQGRGTCRTSGYVLAFNSKGSVETTQDIEVGDSGGVLFDTDSNGDAVIAGEIAREINNGSDEDSDSCGDDALSTTAETIESDASGNFMAM